MPKPIQDQAVVIVGASSGIGRTTARMLAEQGAQVLATARSGEDLATLEQETATAPGTLRTVVGDVDSEESMESVAAAAVQEFGRIDTWVGCAASSVYGRAWEIPAAEYDQIMRTNWLGQVHGALAALPELRRNGGTLVLIGSVESVRAVPLHAPYVSSKMALRGFADALRMDLDDENAGVAVTLVMPAAIDTPFFEHSRSHTGAAPKPPSPVYAPESVANAIIKMAQHPRREVVVGGSAIGFLAGQKFAPGLTDRLMTARQSMARAQQSRVAEQGTDTVDGPATGTGRERGGHGGRGSFATVVTTAGPMVRRAAGLGAAAAGLAASRVMSSRRDRSEQRPTPEVDRLETPETVENVDLRRTETPAVNERR